MIIRAQLLTTLAIVVASSWRAQKIATMTTANTWAVCSVTQGMPKLGSILSIMPQVTRVDMMQRHVYGNLGDALQHFKTR